MKKDRTITLEELRKSARMMPEHSHSPFGSRLKRTIMFRGIADNPSKKRWIYGHLGINKEDWPVITDQNGVELIVLAQTIGQFVRDQGKEKLWEGDICEIRLNGIDTDFLLQKAEVKYNETVCGFGFWIEENSEYHGWLDINSECVLSFAIVSSIHELYMNKLRDEW